MSLAARYSPTQDRPLGGYLVLTAAFGASLAGGLAAASRAAGGELPRMGFADVALVALATQKVSRLVAKDRVTSFVRAPFTRFEGETGHGEVSEQPRGTGLQLSMGELLSCPYCLSQWVAGAFAVGLVGAPRVTRVLAGMWSAQALADAAQLGYAALEERA